MTIAKRDWSNLQHYTNWKKTRRRKKLRLPGEPRWVVLTSRPRSRQYRRPLYGWPVRENSEFEQYSDAALKASELLSEQVYDHVWIYDRDTGATERYMHPVREAG